MPKGKASPSKPDLPKAPPKPHYVQDETIKAAHDADYTAKWKTRTARGGAKLAFGVRNDYLRLSCAVLPKRTAGSQSGRCTYRVR